MNEDKEVIDRMAPYWDAFKSLLIGAGLAGCLFALIMYSEGDWDWMNHYWQSVLTWGME